MLDAPHSASQALHGPRIRSDGCNVWFGIGRHARRWRCGRREPWQRDREGTTITYRLDEASGGPEQLKLSGTTSFHGVEVRVLARLVGRPA